MGDPLTKDRLTWHLNQVSGKGLSALQVNYQGGRSYGLTYPSDPPLMSESWWDLFGWFLKEARSRGWRPASGITRWDGPGMAGKPTKS